MPGSRQRSKEHRRLLQLCQKHEKPLEFARLSVTQCNVVFCGFQSNLMHREVMNSLGVHAKARKYRRIVSRITSETPRGEQNRAVIRSVTLGGCRFWQQIQRKSYEKRIA